MLFSFSANLDTVRRGDLDAFLGQGTDRVGAAGSVLEHAHDGDLQRAKRKYLWVVGSLTM
jgi:hypothetical protein